MAMTIVGSGAGRIERHHPSLPGLDGGYIYDTVSIDPPAINTYKFNP